MISILLIFTAALLFTLTATPVARRVAIATGLVDKPNARKVHTNPIPLLGGAAMYAAFLAALLFFGDRFYVNQTVGIVLGATWVSFLGIWDDWRGLRPYVKLGGQALGAAILVATGVQVEFLHNPVLNVAVTILWVVGITNALNLLDNMDGLSGGVAAVAGAWFVVLSLSNGQWLVASLAAGLVGACLGFLRFNFNPASIFMGDGGSLFLGFVLAAVGIKLRFPDQSDLVTWMIPILVLGVPIFDTSLVFVSRLRRGLNPLTTPGKDHLSHRLVRLGLPPRRAVVVIYLLAGLLGVAALGVQYLGMPNAYALGAAILVAALVTLWRLEQIKT